MREKKKLYCIIIVFICITYINRIHIKTVFLYFKGLEIGSMITTVVANDVDTYPTLTYSWSTSVGLTERKIFALDRYSGRVSLIGSLDYEQARAYRLGIIVSDSEHTASTELSIMITDDNDNPPVFDRPYYTFTMIGLYFLIYSMLDIELIEQRFNRFCLRVQKTFMENRQCK